MVNYALIGAAGYIAPRHLKAMSDTGGQLKVAYDVNDSVGILDSHFPNAAFYTEFEQFQAHIHEIYANETKIDYISICSPNYLHKSHIEFSLRLGSDAICEKPLVLSPSEIDKLRVIEKETGQSINSVLQLRLHNSIIELKEKIAAGPSNKVYNVDLGYFTSRGPWYHSSWKGHEHKSGGIAANIGVHLFDMLAFVFGPIKENIVHHRDVDIAAGYLEFRQARVRWLLSINRDYLRMHAGEGYNTYRSITVEGEEIEFSGGFTELHTQSYHNVLNGNGFGLDDVLPSIETVNYIRHAAISPRRGEQHPDLSKILAP